MQRLFQYIPMNYLLSFFVLILLLQNCQNLTLQGSWTLTSVLDTSGLKLQTSITEQIFREQEIINKIEFQGCETLAYQLNIQDDNIYINIETERSVPISPCDQDGFNALKMIKRWIRGILKFEIKNNQLVLMDPSYDPVFHFSRTLNKTREEWSKSIRGSWMVQLIDDPSSSYPLLAYGTELTICSGAIFSYTIEGLYWISIKLSSKGGCTDDNLLKNIVKVKFYQKYENTLQLYDSSINLLFSAVDTKQILEDTTTVPLSPPAPVVKPVVPTPAQGFPPGKYYLLLLFKRSLGRLVVDLTPSVLSFSLCSKLTFSLKFFQASRIELKSDFKPNPGCWKGDETTYFNILTSIDRYQLDSDGTITLIDKESKSVVSLTIQ